MLTISQLRQAIVAEQSELFNAFATSKLNPWILFQMIAVLQQLIANGLFEQFTADKKPQDFLLASLQTEMPGVERDHVIALN